MTFDFMGVEKDSADLETEHGEFIFLIQRGVLMGLKDTGFLTEAQHWSAERMLYRQNGKPIYEEDIND